jgi:hypothetical protein
MLSSKRLHKLRELLNAEDSKKLPNGKVRSVSRVPSLSVPGMGLKHVCKHVLQVTYSAPPSKFRVCALDTHDTLNPYDHRETHLHRYKAKHQPRRKHTVDPTAYLQHALGTQETMPPTDLSGLLVERSKALQQSEWALLDTLEAHMCDDGHSRRTQQKNATSEQMRSFLDGQMQV